MKFFLYLFFLPLFLTGCTSENKVEVLPQTIQQIKNDIPKTVEFAQVKSLITQKCAVCHSVNPKDTSVGNAGVFFDTDDQIKAKADRIYFRAVEQKTMPYLNKTNITQDERNLISNWFSEISSASININTGNNQIKIDSQALLNNRCQVCHSLNRILNRHDDDKEKWTRTIAKMRAYGAVLNNDEASALIDYLTEIPKTDIVDPEIRKVGTFGKNLVWTSDEMGRTISAIDLDKGITVGTISGLHNPHNIVMSSDGERIIVTDPGNEEVLVFATADGSLIGRFKAGYTPIHAFASPNRKYIVITNQNSNNATVVDYNNFSIIATLPVDNMPHALSISPDSRFVYVANQLSDDVTVLDLQTMSFVTNIQTDKVPVASIVDRTNSFVMVSLLKAGKLIKIDTNTQKIVGSVNVEGIPGQVAISPDNKWAVTGNQNTDTISFIDIEKMEVKANIRTGKWAHGLGISPDKTKLLVTNQEDSTV